MKKWDDLRNGSSNGFIDTSVEPPSGIEIALGFLDPTPIRSTQISVNLLPISGSNWKKTLMPKLVPQPLNGNSKS